MAAVPGSSAAAAALVGAARRRRGGELAEKRTIFLFFSSSFFFLEGVSTVRAEFFRRVRENRRNRDPRENDVAQAKVVASFPNESTAQVNKIRSLACPRARRKREEGLRELGARARSFVSKQRRRAASKRRNERFRVRKQENASAPCVLFPSRIQRDNQLDVSSQPQMPRRTREGVRRAWELPGRRGGDAQEGGGGRECEGGKKCDVQEAFSFVFLPSFLPTFAVFTQKRPGESLAHEKRREKGGRGLPFVPRSMRRKSAAPPSLGRPNRRRDS